MAESMHFNHRFLKQFGLPKCVVETNTEEHIHVFRHWLSRMKHYECFNILLNVHDTSDATKNSSCVGLLYMVFGLISVKYQTIILTKPCIVYLAV